MNRIFAWSTGLALVCAASIAHAEDPFTENSIQATGHAGYGIMIEDKEQDPYGFALGARAGYTLDPHVYVGANFDYFFGESQESPFGFSELSTNLWLLQAEGGYDFGLGDMIVLRPKVGVGIAHVSFGQCYPLSPGTEECEDLSEVRLAVSGGAEALFNLGFMFIVPEARFTFVDEAMGVIFMLGAAAAF